MTNLLFVKKKNSLFIIRNDGRKLPQAQPKHESPGTGSQSRGQGQGQGGHEHQETRGRQGWAGGSSPGSQASPPGNSQIK